MTMPSDKPSATYTFYSAATPNGQKISIMLEELAASYDLRVLDLQRGDQKQPDYLKLNPNGKIPTLVDHENDDVAIFESGAILLYLARKSGRFLPRFPRGEMEVIQWLMFQVASIGPMQGQANVFVRYFQPTLPAVIERFQNETRRLYEVLEHRLSDREYICGDYSIADIATWPWVRGHKWPRVSIEGLPNLTRWIDTMASRPACQRGINIPASMGADKLVHAGRTSITR